MADDSRPGFDILAARGSGDGRESKTEAEEAEAQAQVAAPRIAIAGWDWSYSLSLGTSLDRSEAYHEFRHLLIKGTLLKPTGLKTDQVEVRLLPDRNLDAERRRNHEPMSLGTLELHDNMLVGLIPIPMDALAPILTMLVGDRFKFLAMSGMQMYRRSTRLTGFRLEMVTMEQDEEEPLDE